VKRSIKISDRKFILVVVDLIIILATTLLGLWIHARGLAMLTFNFAYLIDQIGWLVLLSALWLFSAYINGLYDPIKSATLDKTIMLLLRSGTIVMVVYLLVFFYTAPTILLPRGIVVYQVISGFVLISIWRISYIYLAGSTRFKRKILIIGAGWAGKTIAQAILKYASNQYQIVGFIDDDPALSSKTIEIPLSDEDYSLEDEDGERYYLVYPDTIYWLDETVDFSGELDEDVVTFFQLTVNSVNELAIRMALQVFMEDENHVVIDSLFDGQGVLLESAQIDSDGKLIQATEDENSATFEEDKISIINDVAFLRFRAGMHSAKGEDEFVKIYASYALIYEMSFIANAVLNTGDLNTTE
jgi:hypothetical protein